MTSNTTTYAGHSREYVTIKGAFLAVQTAEHHAEVFTGTVKVTALRNGGYSFKKIGETGTVHVSRDARVVGHDTDGSIDTFAGFLFAAVKHTGTFGD